MTVTPERFLQFVRGYASLLAIGAAVRHRVFDARDERALTLDGLVEATGASRRGLAALANALVGFGLPARGTADRFTLNPESAAFLVSDRPGFIGGMFRHVNTH